MDPVEAIAVGGIVPGAKRYPGNVLMRDAVGTLSKPRPLPTKEPPLIRIPVVVETSIPN